LDIGPQEVKDEDNELIGSLGLDLPGYQFICEEDEK
jgi:hypothetical protein